MPRLDAWTIPVLLPEDCPSPPASPRLAATPSFANAPRVRVNAGAAWAPRPSATCGVFAFRHSDGLPSSVTNRHSTVRPWRRSDRSLPNRDNDDRLSQLPPHKSAGCPIPGRVFARSSWLGCGDRRADRGRRIGPCRLLCREGAEVHAERMAAVPSETQQAPWVTRPGRALWPPFGIHGLARMRCRLPNAVVQALLRRDSGVRPLHHSTEDQEHVRVRIVVCLCVSVAFRLAFGRACGRTRKRPRRRCRGLPVRNGWKGPERPGWNTLTSQPI